MQAVRTNNVETPSVETSKDWHGFSFPRAVGIALLGGSLLASGCSKVPVEQLQTTPITEVLNQPARYLGKRIAIEGVTTLRQDASVLCSRRGHTDLLMNADYTLKAPDGTNVALKDSREICLRKSGHLDATKAQSAQHTLKDDQNHKVPVTLVREKGTTNFLFQVTK